MHETTRSTSHYPSKVALADVHTEIFKYCFTLFWVFIKSEEKSLRSALFCREIINDLSL